MIADARPRAEFDRQHNRPDGRPKRAFRLGSEARDYAKYLGVGCTHYRCRGCGWFHNSERTA